MNLRPRAGHFILEAKEPKETKVLMLDKYKKMEYSVVAIGPGLYTDTGIQIAPQVQVGDKVILRNPSNLMTFNHEGKDYTFASEADLLAIILE